jgi:hypothetical protein
MPDIRYAISDDGKLVTFQATSPKGVRWMKGDQATLLLETAVPYRDRAREEGLEVDADVSAVSRAKAH